MHERRCVDQPELFRAYSRTVRRDDVRYLSGVLAVALLIATGCASKSSSTQASSSGGTTAAAGTTGGSAGGGAAGAGGGGAATAAPQGGRGAGPQAAARMTADQLDAAMKTISTTNAALGMKLMSNDLPGAAKDAQTLATTFADVERF